MRAIGKIGVEDPNKHIIEYDNKDEVDVSLESFKKLLSSKNG